MRGGDYHDFAEFYASAFPRLVGQVFLITGDLHDAEDLVQEAMARASARWGRLRDYDVPEGVGTARGHEPRRRPRTTEPAAAGGHGPACRDAGAGSGRASN